MDEAQGQAGGGDLAELMHQVERLERRWRHLPSRGEEGFPSGGRAVLDSLREHGPETVPQIGRRRGTSRQNIQILVNRLKADGWVELVQNPAHKRSELVQLTSRGREAVERLAGRERAYLEELSGHLSGRAVQEALGVLQRLEELLAGRPERKRHRQSESPAPQQATAPPPEPELPVSLL